MQVKTFLAEKDDLDTEMCRVENAQKALDITVENEVTRILANL